MKKQYILIIFFLVAMLGMIGCGKTELGDFYVEGSDYQYMFEGSFIFYKGQARGSNGHFFTMGHYIYYLDDDTKTLVPLCNKVDCLHNKETDESRYEECNAHINNTTSAGEVGIAYCNGYLYFINKRLDWSQDLYRMKEDGSEKQSIYHWEDSRVEEWAIHRDVLYYVEHTYEAVDDKQNNSGTIEHYAVKKLALTGMGNKQPDAIYEVEEGHTVYSLSKVKAYGNHVYFTLHGASVSDVDVITDENVYDYVYLKQIAYDINTGECKLLKLPEEKKGVSLSAVAFWKGKLILNQYNNNQEADGKANSYIADLDGSNVELFEKDKIQGESYISDGKYLYISNSIYVLMGKVEKEYYRIYDQDMNLLDTLELPFSVDPEIGMEEGSYVFWLNDDETGVDLMFFDKSTIGTYHGASAKEAYKKIAEIKFSPEDLIEPKHVEEFE